MYINSVVYAVVNFDGCIYYSNVAGEDGGSVYVYYGTANFAECTIHNSTAGDDGGGVYVYSPTATATFTNCRIYSNKAFTEHTSCCYVRLCPQSHSITPMEERLNCSDPASAGARVAGSGKARAAQAPPCPIYGPHRQVHCARAGRRHVLICPGSPKWVQHL